jgi:hypothetical protein
MTETEWLKCTNPEPMLNHLHGKVSKRKMRLFACACCRRIWHLLTDQRSREAVMTSERFADRQASRTELVASRKNALVTIIDSVRSPAEFAAASVARPNIIPRWIAGLVRVASANAEVSVSHYEAQAKEGKRQVALLAEIIGNPFRLFPPIDRTILIWNDGVVRKLSQVIYDERAFDRLPILADALEEAGCTTAEILNHCRQPGEHVRGCWVVNAILGKS